MTNQRLYARKPGTASQESVREKSTDQVSAACLELYHCGETALQENQPSSAIGSFITALDVEPGFVDCRRALRRAQSQAAGPRKGAWGSTLNAIRLSPALTKLQMLSHFRPLKSISLAERILDQDPTNKLAHEKLARCAARLNLPRTAALSLEVLACEHPGHRAYRMELAGILARTGDVSNAASIYGQILKEHPDDGNALRGLQDMAPAVRPAEAPVAQTQVPESALTRSHSALPPKRDVKPVVVDTSDEAVIQRFEGLLAHGPNNVKFLTTLAAAYARKQMFDNALAHYQRALKAPGGHTKQIEAAMEDVVASKFAAALDGVDGKSPESSALREKIHNQQVNYEWQKMEAAH